MIWVEEECLSSLVGDWEGGLKVLCFWEAFMFCFVLACAVMGWVVCLLELGGIKLFLWWQPTSGGAWAVRN